MATWSFGYTYGNGDSMGTAVFVGATVMLQYAMAAKFISLSQPSVNWQFVLPCCLVFGGDLTSLPGPVRRGSCAQHALLVKAWPNITYTWLCTLYQPSAVIVQPACLDLHNSSVTISTAA